MRQSKQDFFEEPKQKPNQSDNQDLAPSQEFRPKTPAKTLASVRNITSAASSRSQKISQSKVADLEAMTDEVDDILGNRFTESNFMTNLYADDKFLLHRIEYEEQLVQDAKD